GGKGMFRASRAKGLPYLLLLTLVVTSEQRGHGEGDPEQSRPGEKGQNASKSEKSREPDLETFLLERLKTHGRISHPKFPYVILSVESVRGRKLKNLQFLRRGPTGNSYDLVGSAQEAELRVDAERRQVQMHAHYVHLLLDDDANGRSQQAYFAERVWHIALPANAPFLHAEPLAGPAKDEPALSPQAKKFLAEGPLPWSAAGDAILRKAFGNE